MPIESAVRAMLTSASSLSALNDARITHGFRLQDTALPAITFELSDDEYLTIGSAPLRMVSVDLRIIDTTTNDALSLVDEVKSAVRTGTFDSVPFSAVDWKSHSVDAAAVSDGDEAEPAQVLCKFDVYFKD